MAYPNADSIVPAVIYYWESRCCFLFDSEHNKYIHWYNEDARWNDEESGFPEARRQGIATQTPQKMMMRVGRVTTSRGRKGFMYSMVVDPVAVPKPQNDNVTRSPQDLFTASNVAPPAPAAPATPPASPTRPQPVPAEPAHAMSFIGRPTDDSDNASASKKRQSKVAGKVSKKRKPKAADENRTYVQVHIKGSTYERFEHYRVLADRTAVAFIDDILQFYFQAQELLRNNNTEAA